MKTILIALSLLLLFFTPGAHAVVDMKNGNYVDTWTDLDSYGPSGNDPKITRTYNSRSSYQGMFGVGWCSSFETSLFVTAEGNMVVKECGGGMETLYAPKRYSPAVVGKMVKKIVARVKTDPAAPRKDEKEIRDLAAALHADGGLRKSYATRYGISIPVREGPAYYEHGRGPGSIVLRKDVYIRSIADGPSQNFDPEGRLESIWQGRGRTLRFVREQGRLQSIELGNGRRLQFAYNPQGRVIKITAPKGLIADYKYSEAGDLIGAVNAWRNSYAYEYDARHRLIKITFPDKTTEDLSYDPGEGTVLSRHNRNGCLESFRYEVSPEDPHFHYWSTSEKKCDGEAVNSHRYEFFYKRDATGGGKPLLQRVVTKDNDNVSDTAYDPFLGKPLSILIGSDEYKYSYYSDGRLKTETTRYRISEYKYDSKAFKPTMVEKTFFDGKGEKTGWLVSNYAYDTDGNLVKASNSDGKRIGLTYDGEGNIATITDTASRVMTIGYDEISGKSSSITVSGVGTITVEYNPDRTIKNVDSEEGPITAVHVSQMFNEVLDMINVFEANQGI